MPDTERSRPDFSGVWRLNIGKSTLRGEAPKRILMKIEHSEPTIMQHILVRSATGDERRMTFTFNTNGIEKPTAIAGGVGRTRADWQGTELVIESWLTIGTRELHFSDHWSLSADRKTITMAHPDDDLAGQISILEIASPEDAHHFEH